MQSYFDPRGNPTGLVDAMTGTAFPTIRLIAENIEYVKHTSHHLPEIYALWEVRDHIVSLAPSATAFLPLYNNLDELLYINSNLAGLIELYPDVNALIALNTSKQELLDAETYIRSFEERFGDADGAFAQATATAVGAAATATTQASISTTAATNASNAEDNIDAFLMATTTEQVRMAAFIVEINNRMLV